MGFIETNKFRCSCFRSSAKHISQLVFHEVHFVRSVVARNVAESRRVLPLVEKRRQETPINEIRGLRN
jgi:hypothetical protein